MIENDFLRLLIAIQRQPGVGNALLGQIIRLAEGWSEPLPQYAGRPLKELTARLPSGCEAIAQALHCCSKKDLRHADWMLEWCQNMSIGWLAMGDTSPLHRRLAPLARESPPLIHYAGNLGLLKGPCAGVVGAQRPSDAGAALARHCAAVMTELKYTVATGGAVGIDSAAAEAAWKTGGQAILVLPEGLLNSELLRSHPKLDARGPVLLLSECSPAALWQTGMAVQRNRIIAALSEWLCVIESKSRHGSARTAEYAVNLGRPLFYRGGRTEKRYAPLGIGHTLPEEPSAGWFQERLSGPETGGGVQEELF